MSRKCPPTLCWVAALGTIVATSVGSAAERLDLAGGFQPDPVVVAYQATGVAAAAVLVSGCPGYIDAEPAVSATVTGATARLNVFLVGDGSAGVLVAGPDGIHHCDIADQFGIAHIRYERVISGEYQVWPLVSAAGESLSGTLLVSEIELDPRDVASATGLQLDPSLMPPLLSEQPLDTTAEPAFGHMALPEVGAHALTITLSGGVSAADAGPGCVGEINQTRPDATLSLAGTEPLLAISAASSIDTTLLVVAPDGTIFCNDDAVSYNPAIVIKEAAAGEYAIWVGVFGGSAGQEAVLSVSREAPDGVTAAEATPALDPAAEPALGRHVLPQEGLLELPLTLSGGTPAGDAALGCSGEIDPSRPDATVTLEAPEAALWFHAVGENADTTLIVIRPDGEVLCNDDHDSYNPAVGVVDAAAGDYAVWVGVYSGGAGAPAILTVGREEPAGNLETPMIDNPFAGHTIESAAQAFAILSESMQLSEVMTYERLEETGPEGLILHNVLLRDPSGIEAPVEIGRVRISDLDLAGLAANGAPDRFSLAVEDIAYASLAEGARSNDVPLPLLENPPPLSFEVSLLPVDSDMTRRAVRLRLSLDGQIALGFGAQMLWPEGVGAMGLDAMDAMLGESVEIEVHDMGFLGAVLREAAAESGQSVDELVAQGLGEMEAILAPLTPGSPRKQLFDMMSAKFADLTRSGVMRVRVRALAPLEMEALFEALAADQVDTSLLEVEIGYQPDP